MRKPDSTWLAVAALVASCRTTVDPSPDYAEAQAAVREATGVPEVMRPDEPGLEAAEVEAVLAGGLTLAEARQLALLQNRRLRAAFLEIGVSRADYEQSGLLRNPTLGLAYLWPDGGGRERIGAELVQGLGELWQLRFRREHARAELRERVADVAGQAARLAYDVERAWIELAGAQAALEAAEAEVRVARDAVALVRRKVDAGMARSSELAQAEARRAQAELELRLVATTAIEHRRELATLLSLDGDPARLELAPGPTAASVVPDDLETLLALAIERRLDLRAAELAVARAEANVALERSRTLPDVQLGIEWEHPEVGTNTPYVGGFNGAIELPIFDQNLVMLQRAVFQRARAIEERAALRNEAEQDVRSAHAEAEAARRTLELLVTEAAPLASRAAELARSGFAVGHATALEVLEADARRVAVERAIVGARLQLALARLALARATGGALPAGE